MSPKSQSASSISTRLVPSEREALARLAGHWSVDPARTSVTIRTRTMWGLLPVRGNFTRTSGRAEVDADGTATGTFVIDAASLSTGVDKRDVHLRSVDFFDIEHHPSFRFTLDEMLLRPDTGWSALGRLSILGVVHPVATPAELTTHDDAVRLDTRLALDRSRWGMDWNRARMSADRVVVTVSATFVRE